MRIVKYDEALDLLNKAVELKGGDYVYQPNRTDSGPSCLYAKDGQPDCIVGHVLVDLGIPASELEYKGLGETENTLSFGPIGEIAVTIQYTKGIRFTPKARRLLSIAQSQQDNGVSWGASVGTAIQMANSLPWLADEVGA